MDQPVLNWEMYLWQKAALRAIGRYVPLQRQLPRIPLERRRSISLPGAQDYQYLKRA